MITALFNHLWQSTLAAEIQPAFEVASIRPDRSGATSIGIFPSPGMVRVRNYTLKFLIEDVYRLKRYQVLGGPSWIDSDRYDIVAKAGGGARYSQMMPMLQTLLADRFKLKFHRETRQLLIYSLVVAKGGPKFRQSNESAGDSTRLRITDTEISGHKASMKLFADALSAQLDRPLVDRTGLVGDFDFAVRYTPDDSVAEDANAPSGTSIYTALKEQLGLKLEPRKGPVEVLVIDRAEKPSEN